MGWFEEPRSLRLLLPGLLAALIFITVAPVVAFSYVIATDSTNRLLSRQLDLVLDGVEAKMRRHIEPAEAQLAELQRAIAAGQVHPENEPQFSTFVMGLLGATPQVRGLVHVRPDQSIERWSRQSLTSLEEEADAAPLGAQALEDARAGRQALWAEPFVSPIWDDTVLNHRVALINDREFLGIMGASIRASDIGRYLETLSDRNGVTAFVLSGKTGLLAYPGKRISPTNNGTQLPTLEEATNPVVRNVWNTQNPIVSSPSASKGHWAYIGDVPYTYVYREIESLGAPILTIVAGIPSAQTRWARWAPTLNVALGSALALLAMMLAWRMGQRMVRPVTALDTSLAHIEKLEFDQVDVDKVQASNVLEWHQMANRIDRTAGALSRLSRYVPKVLTRQLLAGHDTIAEPQERELSILFADLEGFSAFAAARSPREAAEFLSNVFGTIGPVIENNGGVIDKYTGDGLLAFWGAPILDPDHNAQAVLAGLAMAKAFQELDDGPRLRIGIHTGMVIVGEMGFPGRVDFTLAGQAVNVTERIQSALRGVDPDARAIIGLSKAALDAAQQAGIDLHAEPLSDQRVADWEEPVWKLQL